MKTEKWLFHVQFRIVQKICTPYNCVTEDFLSVSKHFSSTRRYIGTVPQSMYKIYKYIALRSCYCFVSIQLSTTIACIVLYMSVRSLSSKWVICLTYCRLEAMTEKIFKSESNAIQTIDLSKQQKNTFTWSIINICKWKFVFFLVSFIASCSHAKENEYLTVVIDFLCAIELVCFVVVKANKVTSFRPSTLLHS